VAGNDKLGMIQKKVVMVSIKELTKIMKTLTPDSQPPD